MQARPFPTTHQPAPHPSAPHTPRATLPSRPVEHLHLTVPAKAVPGCHDHHQYRTTGDLNTQTGAEILCVDTMARLRKWTYGVEEAPEDFLCRRCEFAIGE